MPVEQSVNEQTASITPEHIEINPGESFASFDDLEGAKSRAERNEQTSAKPRAEKPASEDKSSKSKEKSGDKKDDESVSDSDDKAKKPDGKAAEKDKLAQGQVKPARTIKLKNGEEETEFPATAEIPVKINGQEQLVKIEELVSNYSGKKAWSDEFGKLGAEKQKFKHERDLVVGQLGQMFEVSKTDPIAGLMKMAELAGMDPVKYRQDFLSAMQPALEKRLEMSDAERRAADAEAEASFYRSQTQSRADQEKQHADYQAYEAKVLSQIQAEGLSREQFESTYQALAQAVQAGQYRPKSGELSLEDVTEVAAIQQKLEATEKALTELEVELTEQEKEKFLATFIPWARREKMSPGLVKETLSEYFKDQKATNLSKKIRKSQPEKIAQAAVRAPRNPGSDPIGFEDL